MIGYEPETKLEKAVHRLAKTGVYTMTPKEAHAYCMKIAKDLNLDLSQANLAETKNILSKGMPLSHLIREMREE